jgi:hypothetical protein
VLGSCLLRTIGESGQLHTLNTLTAGAILYPVYVEECGLALDLPRIVSPAAGSSKGAVQVYSFVVLTHAVAKLT